MFSLRRLLTLMLAMLFFITLVSARGTGIDLIITNLSIDVVSIDDYQYEIVINANVIQQEVAANLGVARLEGLVSQGRLIFRTPWDVVDNLIWLDEESTPVNHSFIVPEDYLGRQVEVTVEVWPVDLFEYDESNNYRATSVRIPSARVPQNADDGNRGSTGYDGGGDGETPTIPPWLIYLVGFLLAAGVINAVFSGPKFDFKFTLHDLAIRASENPPSHPKKGQYWIKKELAVQPTRWQLAEISIETEPKTGTRNASPKLVAIISQIIDRRKRGREEESSFWEYEAFDDFVARSYPIHAKFVWLNTRIRQMKLTVTFTLYRFDGAGWREIFSKDFSKSGTYDHVIPLQSQPQTYEAAGYQIGDCLTQLIDELVDWPFKQ